MKIAIKEISKENLGLIKDYFPGIEIVDTDYDSKFTKVESYADAMKLIHILRKIAPYYLQEFVEDSEDYEKRS